MESPECNRLNLMASMVRFEKIFEASAKLTHHSKDNHHATTIKKSLATFAVRSLHGNSPGMRDYLAGIEAADSLCLRLAISTPEYRDGLFEGFEDLRHNRDNVRWAAIDAHMRNEECANLDATIVKIADSYSKKHRVYENSKQLLLMYACAVVCELWGLDQLKSSIRRGTHPRLTPSMFREFQYANIILWTHLKLALQKRLFYEGLSNVAESRTEYWMTKRLINGEVWDETFDEAVALRAYHNDLGQKCAALEPKVVSLRLIAEANAMASGWELIRFISSPKGRVQQLQIGNRGSFPAHLADARKQMKSLSYDYFEAERECDAFDALVSKWDWLRVLKRGPTDGEGRSDTLDDATTRWELSRYVTFRRMRGHRFHWEQLSFPETWSTATRKEPLTKRSMDWWSARTRSLG